MIKSFAVCSAKVDKGIYLVPQKLDLVPTIPPESALRLNSLGIRGNNFPSTSGRY